MSHEAYELISARSGVPTFSTLCCAGTVPRGRFRALHHAVASSEIKIAMNLHPPFCRAHKFDRAHQARRPWLENLEPRLALSGTSAGISSSGAEIKIEPTVLEEATPIWISEPSTGTGSTAGAEPQTYGQASPWGLSPAQIRNAYDVTNIAFGSITGNGAGQTIAIVDAYDDPSFVDSTSAGFSSSDLARFDQEYGLPDPPSFTKFNESGNTSALPGTDPVAPGTSGDWEEEEALDVEWAHAIAPGAAIDLVEASTDNGSDLYQAVVAAASLPGVSVVSTSWGSPEFAGEQAFDHDFTTPAGHQGVTFVASSGDAGSPGLYPAYSPNVLAVGGTSLTLNADGSYGSELAWDGSGGGTSTIEAEPSFQMGLQHTGMRTIPDVSFDADPVSGVSVYDSYNDTSGNTPWIELGGTSMAAPCWAGIIAIADEGRAIEGAPTLDGPSQTLSTIAALPAADFHDITAGSNGGYSAAPGYDEVTGLGTPVANLVVAGLASYDVAAGLSFVASIPPELTAGTPFNLTVAIDNSQGGLDSNYIGTVTLSLADGPAGSAIEGTTTVVVTNGIASFSGLMVTQAGSGYALMAHTAGPGTAASNQFTVNPAAPAHLVLTSATGVVSVGERLTVTAEVEDAFGNLISDYSGTTSLTFVRKAARASRHGIESAAIANGVAVFGSFRVNQKYLGDELQISSDGLNTAISSPVRVIRAAVNSSRTESRGPRAQPKTASPSVRKEIIVHTAEKPTREIKSHLTHRNHIAIR